MTEQLKPCPFCGNKFPELVDNRVEFFVRCNKCKPFATIIYGKAERRLDHVSADTDEEADRLSRMAFDAVDWDDVKQSAIDAWNTRSDGWISAKASPTKESCQVIAEWSNGDVEQSSYITDWGRPHFQRKCGTDENGTGWKGNVGYVVNWMPLPKAASCGE